MGKLPLEGVRIVDLTQAFAGPWATMLLSEFGAEVIKIEAPGEIPPFRRQGAARGGAYSNGSQAQGIASGAVFYHQANYNKLSVSLNLAKPQGAALFKDLVKISDVVIENFSSRTMGNLGLDYPTLQSLKPEIIMVSMPGYGTGGPYSHFVTLGPGIDAMSGMQSTVGYEGGQPLKASGFYSDQNEGAMAATATLMALYARRRTGLGQHVEVAMRDTLSQFVGQALMDAILNDRAASPRGNRHPSMAPHGCYPCRGNDAWVTIAIATDEEWQRFCPLAGHPEWATNPRFTTMTQRYQHQQELDTLISDWTRTQDHYEVMHRLQAQGLVAAAVLNSKELLEDPHFKARQVFVKLPTEGGNALTAQIPARLSRTPAYLHRPGPYFGEHTEYVFGQLLELSEDAIKGYVAQEVICIPEEDQ